MIILMSKYRAPFSEPPVDGVHYISLDDQADMAKGKYDAHIRLYYSLIESKSTSIEIHNSLTGETTTHNRETFLKPFAKQPFQYLDPTDRNFLRSLSRDFGLRSAFKRLESFESPAAVSNVIHHDFYKKPPEPLKKEKKKPKGRKQKLFELLLSMKPDSIE